MGSDLELSPEVLQEFNEYVYGRLEVMGWLVLWSVGMTSPNGKMKVAWDVRIDEDHCLVLSIIFQCFIIDGRSRERKKSGLASTGGGRRPNFLVNKLCFTSHSFAKKNVRIVIVT